MNTRNAVVCFRNVAQLQAAVCNSEEHVNNSCKQMSSQVVAGNEKVRVKLIEGT